MFSKLTQPQIMERDYAEQINIKFVQRGELSQTWKDKTDKNGLIKKKEICSADKILEKLI